MGLAFLVPSSTDELLIEVEWGDYGYTGVIEGEVEGTGEGVQIERQRRKVEWDDRVADLHYCDVFEFAVGHGSCGRSRRGPRHARPEATCKCNTALGEKEPGYGPPTRLPQADTGAAPAL